MIWTLAGLETTSTDNGDMSIEETLQKATKNKEGAITIKIHKSKRMNASHEVRHTIAKSNTTTKIYMDDRTIVAPTVAQGIVHSKSWDLWSTATGLSENAAKLQIVIKKHWRKTVSAQLKKAGVLEKHVKEQAEVLGASVGYVQGPLGKKKKERFEAASQRATIISSLLLSRDKKLEYCRAFAIAKLSYGWVSRRLPSGEASNIIENIYGSAGVLRGYSRALRDTLLGVSLAVSCVVGCRQVGLLMRLVKDGSINATDAGINRAARTWMRRLGGRNADKLTSEHTPNALC